MAKIIKHYGTPRRSGRYPWGSGDDAYQSGKSFLGAVDELKKQGLSEVEIAKGLGLKNTAELRKKRSIARASVRAANVAQAQRLLDKGYSKTAIGERMGVNESTVRSWLDESINERVSSTALTADILADAVDKKEYIQIGVGVEATMGISRTRLNTAVQMLQEQGYEVHTIKVLQVGTGKYTNVKVLAPPGTTLTDISKNREKISTVDSYSEDGGRTFLGIEPPVSVDSSRILIRYGDEGGADKDGVIQLRQGVDDLSLGNAHYAQVRVAVDGTHYMKGMAMYANDIPSGYDIVYNTNKKSGTPASEVFKQMKTNEDGSIDQDNPFGAILRQKHYTDADGNEHLSPLNIVGAVPGAGEEGAWGKWSKSISSQILSKQTPALAEKQLGLALNLKKEEFDEIMSLTNPTIRKKLLETYADGADSAAVHLKAAALPRQATQVLLPFNSIKENEVYAPNYKDGENVVLIRHPHGGIFEIPELRVNNKNAEAIELIGRAKDAIGINPKVAARLSGADFDGDVAIVIPNKDRLIQTSKPIQSLKDFDPKTSYPKYEGMPVITGPRKQQEMGKVSNLITDMTIQGATRDEIARAVRHSMVVIDAEKHELNYQQSYIDNNIAGLKEKYQGGANKGAATIISKAKSSLYVDERREGVYVEDPVTGKSKRVYVDPKTGRKLYEETGRTYPERKRVTDPDTGKTTWVETGKVIKRQTKTTKMAEADDARKLSSGTEIEEVYASHANALKALALKARKIAVNTKDRAYSPAARKTYSKEVESLKSKLTLAFMNKPRERAAQLLANQIVAAKKRAQPDMDKATLKKVKAQALEEARTRSGAKKFPIEITDHEWNAIQAGAISASALRNILDNTDLDKVKERAMPRTKSTMSPARLSRARAMTESGYTAAEIANALGVSVSTLSRALNE